MLVSISIFLFFPVKPKVIFIADFGTLSIFDKIEISSLFAWPSIGCDFKNNLREPLVSVFTEFLLEPVETRISILTGIVLTKF